MNKQAALINIDKDFQRAVEEAARLYESGEVFVYPTDTIYGFGCNPFNDHATEMIDTIKERKQEKRYILLIDSIDTLNNYVEFRNDNQKDFLNKIWPGPVSAVLNLNARMHSKLNYFTAAFRIPENKFCKELLASIKLPLVSTSVNRRDEKPLNDYKEIARMFGDKISAIFYTDKPGTVTASTLIDLTGEEPVLLREGKIKFVELMKKFG